jgi:hypothetical protein
MPLRTRMPPEHWASGSSRPSLILRTPLSTALLAAYPAYGCSAQGSSNLLQNSASDRRPRHTDLLAQQPLISNAQGAPKVSQLPCATRGPEHVFTLDVPVHNALKEGVGLGGGGVSG